MTPYEITVADELKEWTRQMESKPGMVNRISKTVQDRINRVIPDKVHRAITAAIKGMIQAVLFGAEFTTREPIKNISLQEREILVRQKIKQFSNTAAAEGAITGAGGIFLGLADFPLWLTLKMKMLFEIAALYGRNTGNFRERLYMLYIFELAFSSQKNRNLVFEIVKNWNTYQQNLPTNIDNFDWRSFQQEYRDYIDIAKLLQLVPGIGAAVGLVVNHRLTNQLGKTAMNAYRLHYPFESKRSLQF